MLVVKGDVYYSDSDSDDDVDRYVFLARQPAPAPAAGLPAEDSRGASSENDDDGGDDDDAGATTDEEEPERGGGRRKRKPLDRREISDDDSPPPPPPPKKKKKGRIELIAPPLAQTTPQSGSGSETESDPVPSPCGVRAGESGSEGSHGTKVHEHHRAPGIGGEAKNATKKRKRVACGKRRRGSGSEEDGDRAVTAAAAAKGGASSPAATSGRFLCNLCDRCFDSFQALGGHVLGHRKKAKIAIAAAACLDDAGGAGDCEEEEAAVVEADEETASSIAHAGKMAAAAARRGKANGGGGGGDGKIKTVDGVAGHRKDVDSGGHDDANGDASFRNKGNAIAASGQDFFTNGGNSRSNGKKGIGAGIPNQKVVAGTCHEGASGDDGNAGRTLTLYKCKVCGTELLTGRALGGHMRKHRKRPPPAVGVGEGRSPTPPTDDDCQIPLARMFGAETGMQRENKIGWV